MKFYFLVLIFIFSTTIAQQTTSEWYGMSEGLPQNGIKDITKDKFGFIWLATEGGIVRFDGSNFITYNNLNTSSLSFKDFLNYGKNDIICFNNSEKECVLISNRTAKLIPIKKVERTYSIQKEQYKRFYKNTLTGKFYQDVNYYFIKTNIGKYFFDNYRIEYESKGVPRKVISSKVFKHSYLKNAFEQNGIIYIADPKNRKTMILQNGLIKFDNKPSLYNDPKSTIYWHQGTKQVFVINQGNIYISKILKGNPTLKFILYYKNIENEFLNCMFFDEEYNKMYFGHGVRGLGVINLSNFHIPQKNIAFAGEFVYESLPYTINSVITRQGLEYSDNSVKKIFSSDIKNDKRFALYDNSENLLYIDFKLYRRYRKSNFQKKDSISFPQKSIDGIYKSWNTYMVALSDYNSTYYLYIYDNDQFRKAKHIFKFKESINFVKAYNHDLFYIGTSNGIYLVSISNNKVVRHIAKDLPIKEIQCTKDGNFWFTTYNKGFYLLKNTSIIKMPNDKDDYILNAHHILEDHNGDFWISSNNGLFKVSEKLLLNYADKKSKVLYYRYSKENGLLNNEFNGSSNPSGNILPNGEFVFPSMEGFVFFKPDEIKAHYPKKNQLFIERAQVGKEFIDFKNTLYLKSDFKNADIFLDIPYYYNIDNLYLEAKLDNSKTPEWKDIKSDRKYALNNIDPGNYTLWIRFLVGKNGKFVYKKIFIEIKPFFYQTFLFKILIVILSAGAIILIIQFRTNFLKIKNKKLKNNLYNSNQELQEASHHLAITKNQLKNESEYQQKIMESISHDIMTPVKFIALLSQKINDTNDPQTQKKYFDGIHKSAEQLFIFTLNLKDYNEIHKDDLVSEEHSLYDIIENKRLLFEHIASEKNSEILNLSEPSLKIKTNKNIVAIILHNLIDNAVKHTVNGKIIIKTILNDSIVLLEISDTGTGMSKTQIQYYCEASKKVEKETFPFNKYGFGLDMVIQLSKKIGAAISFHNNVPQGTIVKILLKKY